MVGPEGPNVAMGRGSLLKRLFHKKYREIDCKRPGINRSITDKIGILLVWCKCIANDFTIWKMFHSP